MADCYKLFGNMIKTVDFLPAKVNRIIFTTSLEKCVLPSNSIFY